MDRRDLPRMDHELSAAGITPGHPSLYASPDTEPVHEHHEHHEHHDHEPAHRHH